MRGDSEKLAEIFAAAEEAKTIAGRLSLRDLVMRIFNEREEVGE
jgi:hypothetical protein